MSVEGLLEAALSPIISHICRDEETWIDNVVVWVCVAAYFIQVVVSFFGLVESFN